ncbi:hypothetical protein [Desulfotruncus alcoholivorax]|uniref:hypothetical protein n=1 Tax=Desulfotruncus alcoholivorax TaxID=265477 RepID=UPI000402DC06|nr:hypothetical protein [Desulfotruncus alcoholivorax]
MAKILFDEQPIVVDKVLAVKIGLNKAIVIQQVHYWIEINKKKKKHYINGRYWTYNTLQEWHENNFEFWSLDTVKRTFTELENKGILLVGNFNQDRRDRTKWYTIDYNKLEELISKKESHSPEKSKSANCTNAIDDTGIHRKSAICTNANGQNALLEKGNMHRPLPETYYTEISNRDYPSIHPSANIDNRILNNKPEGWTDGSPAIIQKPVQNQNKLMAGEAFNDQVELSRTNKIIKELCQNTGANPVQVQEAIRRANQIEERGRLKGNYLKLVESIARTIVKEDLVKSRSPDNGEVSKSETRNKNKKELIKSLYRN